MTLLIILNILLIVLLVILVLYLFGNKKDNTKNVCVDDDKCDKIEDAEYIEHKRKDKINSERVFVGRFITDEEYQQMKRSRKSDISILLEEVNSEYEHLKELNK